jgi:hypothetical protein
MSGSRKSSTKQPTRTILTRQGGFQIPEGPWSVSYYMVDHEGDFAWPEEADPKAAELRLMLDRLTRRTLPDVFQITRDGGGGAANKIVEVEALSPGANLRLNDLATKHSDKVPRLDGFVACEFTYCLRRYSPERIWSYLDLERRTAYPIWWDPDHRVAGYTDAYAHITPGGPCPLDCLHP